MAERECFDFFCHIVGRNGHLRISRGDEDGATLRAARPPDSRCSARGWEGVGLGTGNNDQYMVLYHFKSDD